MRNNSTFKSDAMSLLYVLLGLVAVLCYFAMKRRPKGKPIPGPAGLPLIGNGLEITSETLHLKLSEYAKKYGDVVQVKIFTDNIICLNSADLIRKAFNDDPYKKFLNDRPATFWGQRILSDSQSIGFYPRAFGGIHGDLRKGITKAFHVYGDGVKEFEEKIAVEIQRLLKVIDEKGGKDFEFISVIKRSLSNTMAYLLIGEQLEDDDEDVEIFWQLDSTTEYLLNAFTNTVLLNFPFLVHLPGYYKSIYKAAADAKTRVLRRYFDKVRETHKPGVVRGIIDSLFDEQAREIAAGGQVVFTDERIKSNLLETIAAGILTTLTGITASILVLVHHPEYQERVQKELDDVIGPDRLPTLEDRQNCPFLAAIETEATRYITIVPLLLPHYTNSDVEFEGYSFPAGSLIIPNVWHVHHDEAVWGDPWKFRPERWLDESGKLYPSTHPMRKHWITFGTGRRQCSGEQFGRSRLFLFLASLLKTYKFTPTPGKCGSCDPRYGEFDVSLIMRPKPYYVRAEKRN